MHLHILGICGTFMGGVARLAVELGHRVSGSDQSVYPPMSDQLRALGIELIEDWDLDRVPGAPDSYLIGNVLSRGNPAVEAILNRRLPYLSGPEWLGQAVLRDRHVLAVSGTHGKTTTSSLLAFLLDEAGMEPGFLIGGVPENFGVSARLGAGKWFVIEADEYDTAFFDKGAKFLHYRPQTLILNNLEYDHADIFDDLQAIVRQFHHLVRTVPGNGLIVHNAGAAAVRTVLDQGSWTPTESFGEGGTWRVAPVTADASSFDLYEGDRLVGTGVWDLCGGFNAENASAAIAAARHVGISPRRAIESLARFRNAKRRLEILAQANGITLYDDFAHHPTAVRVTLEALRARVGAERIIAVVDLASRSMRMGIHQRTLAAALAAADEVYLHAGERVEWDPVPVVKSLGVPGRVLHSPDAVVAMLRSRWRRGDHLLLMSNGGFGGAQAKLAAALSELPPMARPRH